MSVRDRLQQRVRRCTIHASGIDNVSFSVLDTMAEKAMELIGANIRRFVENRRDADAACNARQERLRNCLAWARLGNIHAMSHLVARPWCSHGVAMQF